MGKAWFIYRFSGLGPQAGFSLNVLVSRTVVSLALGHAASVTNTDGPPGCANILYILHRRDPALTKRRYFFQANMSSHEMSVEVKWENFMIAHKNRELQKTVSVEN